jgi:N-acetylglucosamine kinase-like BadF-type ATPase
MATLGELEVEKVLHEVMELGVGGAVRRPRSICLGIAGVDRAEDAAIIRSIMRRIGNKAPVLVVNDALIALEAGAGDGPGIVLIAGTGSICYGRNDEELAGRAGGWGYILADEGSGWWMGQRAIQAVMRQADGEGPPPRSRRGARVFRRDGPRAGGPRGLLITIRGAA